MKLNNNRQFMFMYNNYILLYIIFAFLLLYNKNMCKLLFLTFIFHQRRFLDFW